MKTNTNIFGRSASTASGPRAMIALNEDDLFQVTNFNFSSTKKRSVISAIRGDVFSIKALDVVDTISASGEGLPTEKAVSEYVKVEQLFSGATLELDLSATVGQYRAIIVAETFDISATGVVSAIIVVSPTKSGSAVGQATYKNGIEHFLLYNGILTSYSENTDGGSGSRNNYIRYVYGIK